MHFAPVSQPFAAKNRVEKSLKMPYTEVYLLSDMIITYQGNNYFKIQSGEFAILIDPENQRSFRGTQIIVNTVKPALAEPAAEGEGERPFWIENAGEYEVKGVRVQGWTTGNDGKTVTTAYRILFDEIALVVLGHLGGELSPAITSELADADIAIVPAGGKPYLAQSEAAKLVRQLEPGIVIPALFKDAKPFLKELDQTDVNAEEKLVIKKKDIAPKAMRVRWLGQ